MNMGRVAAGGRNWEGFGGDPFLTGVCAAETIHGTPRVQSTRYCILMELFPGVQSTGVIACAKHYVGNEQEHYRGGSGATASSSNIDDRTMHEIYVSTIHVRSSQTADDELQAWPFAESVRAGVGSVMSSYQRINQTHASENSKTINGILKGELAFNGFVVSDWAATSSGVNSALAGLDMNMVSDSDMTILPFLTSTCFQPGFIAYGNQSQDNPVLSNVSYW
jgi:beta-glucosidase